MNKLNIKRQSFSSPAQLRKMTRMVVARWQEVWPEVFGRQQQIGQQSSALPLNGLPQPGVAPDRF